MKRIFILLVLFKLLSQYGLVFSENYYRSNSIGMVFEEIPAYRIDEYDWVLKIKDEGSPEIRIIYFQGEEIRRFKYIKEGKSLLISEYEGTNLIHVEQIENGLVLKEENYKNNILISEYIYEWADRRLNKTTYIENNLIIYEDQFILGEHGRIIQTRRLFNDGQLSTSGFSNVNQGISQEWHGTEKEFILYKYSEGRVFQIETWQNGILSRSRTSTFTDSGSTVIETDLLTGNINEKIIDLNNNVLSETNRNGNIVENIQCLYNENLLIQKDIASSGIREKYFYEYDSDNKLQLERILKDNMLIKEIFYVQGKKTLEKLYKDNSLLLIITYKDGDKIKEEYIQ